MVVFAVATGALLLSSAAFACTWYTGKMTVTAGGGSTISIGTGSGMNYCAGYPKDTAGAPAGGAHGRSGGSIQIAVAPASGCNTKKLTAQTYFANFVNGAAYTFTINAATHRRSYSGWKIDCMTRGGIVKGLTPSTLTVPASGTAAGTFHLPASLKTNGPSDASAVCLTDGHAFYGNQVPIVIV
jgi:hypothetical protein